jgi:hypothetical protein
LAIWKGDDDADGAGVFAEAKMGNGSVCGKETNAAGNPPVLRFAIGNHLDSAPVSVAIMPRPKVVDLDLKPISAIAVVSEQPNRSMVRWTDAFSGSLGCGFRCSQNSSWVFQAPRCFLVFKMR